MSETTTPDTECESCPKPSFRGCVFCYTAEWGLFGLRKLYRAIRR